MPISRTTEYECDVCGKKEVAPSEGKMPLGWISFGETGGGNLLSAMMGTRLYSALTYFLCSDECTDAFMAARKAESKGDET